MLRSKGLNVEFTSWHIGHSTRYSIIVSLLMIKRSYLIIIIDTKWKKGRWESAEFVVTAFPSHFPLPVPIVPIGRLSSTFTKKEESTTMNRIYIQVNYNLTKAKLFIYFFVLHPPLSPLTFFFSSFFCSFFLLFFTNCF